MTDKTLEQQIADLTRERDYLKSLVANLKIRIDDDPADYNIPWSLLRKIEAYIDDGVLLTDPWD
jgi:hypothetical protein